MKTTLLLLFFLIISISSLAQQVYSEKEFNTLPDLKKIQLTYHSDGLFDTNDQKVFAERLKQREQFEKKFLSFSIEKGFPPSSFHPTQYIELKFYAQPDGKIDYCIYNKYREEDTLTREDETKIKNLLIAWVETHKLSVQSNQAFIWKVSVAFGQQKIRNVRSGAIGTMEEAEKNQSPELVRFIDFSSLDLSEVPTVIYRFKYLTELDLSKNSISKLPKKLTKLKYLKIINLSNNVLNEKIKFKRNHHLKSLNLLNNQIEKFPRQIKKNKALENLFLGNNNIKSLKNRDFKGLSSLIALNLYNVGFSNLPASVRLLTNIEELDLYYNHLRTLPKEISELSHLKTLALAFNEIDTLPSNLYNLKNLEQLYLHHNRLYDLPKLPETLKLLDIGHNYFSQLPATVFDLTRLEEFDISFNQLTLSPTRVTEIKSLKNLFWSNNKFLEKPENKAWIDEALKIFKKNTVEVH